MHYATNGKLNVHHRLVEAGVPSVMRCSAIAQAMLMPSAVDVARPSSSMRTRLLQVRNRTYSCLLEPLNTVQQQDLFVGDTLLQQSLCDTGHAPRPAFENNVWGEVRHCQVQYTEQLAASLTGLCTLWQSDCSQANFHAGQRAPLVLACLWLRYGQSLAA